MQESAPERYEVKLPLLQAISAALPASVIISSSTSGLLVSKLSEGSTHPERIVIGHPFNPPHLIPLVEVVGGSTASDAAVDGAIAFYRAIGKHPIHLKREIRGHVANRLQAALWQEAFNLVQAGVASVEDVDAAIAHGPGLRWALLGPFLNLHLSGGAGGIGALFEKPLWAATEGMWRDLGTVHVDAALGAEVAAGVAQELAAHDPAEMVRQRDATLLALLRLKAAATELP